MSDEKKENVYNPLRNCLPNYEAQAFTEHEKLLWITQDRLSKFIDDEQQWRDVNMSKNKWYYEYNKINIKVYSPTFKQRPLFNEMMKNGKDKFKGCNIGDKFGPSWSSHWFKLELNIPEHWENKEIHLIFNSSSEAALYNEYGEYLQGFAGGTDQLRTQYMFDTTQTFPVILYVEMSCNHPFGCGDEFLKPPPRDRTFELKECKLGLFNRDAWDLYWDLSVLYDMTKELDKMSQIRQQALRTANKMINVIDPDDVSTYDKARKIGKEIFDQIASPNEHVIHAIGNCHIDTAWYPNIIYRIYNYVVI